MLALCYSDPEAVGGNRARRLARASLKTGHYTGEAMAGHR